MVGTDRRDSPRVEPATILVVDDSSTTRMILRRALSRAGHQIVEAADGAQGLHQARASQPDMILLDIDMPVVDGITMMRQLQEDAALAEIPVLFLTARTDASDVAAGLSLGAQDYLRKPCETGELLARVTTALRLRAQAMDLRTQAATLYRAHITDPLTGVGNRRRLEETVAELMAGPGPGLVVGVLLVDADHFKQVNDVHGHGIGDVVLRVIARRTASAVGAHGHVVRWGGEEFVALVPTTEDLGAEGVYDLAERVRHSVGNSPIAASPSLQLDITVSIGVAAGRIADLDDILSRADGGLYRAKAEGRNRTVRG